jgi:hypothetical protein
MENKDFDDILNECLERLLIKGETVEQCLAGYPEQAAELRPLLETALATKKASAIQPRPEFRARARYQFHSAIQSKKPGRLFFGWQPRWVATLAIVLVLLLAGSGTVAAASGSMPGEPLYPVKIVSEQAQLAFTPSTQGKAELYTRLADKRVAEIIYVAEKGDARQVGLVAQRLDNYLVRIASLVSTESSDQSEEGGLMRVPAPAMAPEESAEKDTGVNIRGNRWAGLRIELTRYATEHPAALRAVLQRAPESAKPVLLRAINTTVAGYKKALEAAATD